MFLSLGLWCDILHVISYSLASVTLSRCRPGSIYKASALKQFLPTSVGNLHELSQKKTRTGRGMCHGKRNRLKVQRGNELRLLLVHHGHLITKCII